jgi:hypothetical protein
MLLSRYQKVGQKHSIKIGNRSIEDVATFKYLGTTLTDKNCMHEKIKNRLNSRNPCYHSVQSVLSSHLLSKNVKVKICKTIILPVVWYGCETWSLTLSEKNRLGVFQNRMLRRIFGPRREEATAEEWRKLHNGELHNLYSYPNIIRQIKSRTRWAGHVACLGEEREVHKVFVGKPEGKRQLGRPRRRSEDGTKMDLRQTGWEKWSGFTLLRIGTVGGLL